MRGDLVRKLAARGLAAGLAVLAFLACALTPATGWGLGLTVAAATAAWVERRVRPQADLVAETVLLAVGVLVAYQRRLGEGPDWILVPTAVVLLGLILAERPLREAGALEIQAINLHVRSLPLRVTAHLGTAILALLAGLAAGWALGLPAWPAMVVTLLLGAACAGAALAMLRHRLKRTELHSAVEQQNPAKLNPLWRTI